MTFSISVHTILEVGKSVPRSLGPSVCQSVPRSIRLSIGSNGFLKLYNHVICDKVLGL